MLQNAYLDAEIGVDTAENEPIEKSAVSWQCYASSHRKRTPPRARHLFSDSEDRSYLRLRTSCFFVSSIITSVASALLFITKLTFCAAVRTRLALQRVSLEHTLSGPFPGLVLVCINADFCDQGRILQHFSTSLCFPLHHSRFL